MKKSLMVIAIFVFLKGGIAQVNTEKVIVLTDAYTEYVSNISFQSTTSINLLDSTQQDVHRKESGQFKFTPEIKGVEYVDLYFDNMQTEKVRNDYFRFTIFSKTIGETENGYIIYNESGNYTLIIENNRIGLVKANKESSVSENITLFWK